MAQQVIAEWQMIVLIKWVLYDGCNNLFPSSWDHVPTLVQFNIACFAQMYYSVRTSFQH
jgi:hypothetical protein